MIMEIKGRVALSWNTAEEASRKRVRCQAIGHKRVSVYDNGASSSGYDKVPAPKFQGHNTG